LDEAIGRVDLLDVAPAVGHWKERGLDLSAILHAPAGASVAGAGPAGTGGGATGRRTTVQDHELESVLDRALIAEAAAAFDRGAPVEIAAAVPGADRSVGAMLGGEVTRVYGPDGLPDDTIRVHLTGTAGQSLGAFLPRGVTLRLRGDANDY